MFFFLVGQSFIPLFLFLLHFPFLFFLLYTSVRWFFQVVDVLFSFLFRLYCFFFSILFLFPLPASSAKKSEESTNEEAHTASDDDSLKQGRKRIFNICAWEWKKRRKCGPFSYSSSLSLSPSLSFSLVFWIFGKVVKGKKKKKEEKKREGKRRKMTKSCPQIPNTKIINIFQWFYLSLCHHLLGNWQYTNVVKIPNSIIYGWPRLAFE